MSYKKLTILLLLTLSHFENVSASPYRCEDVVQNFFIGHAEYAKRKELIATTPRIQFDTIAYELKKSGALIFKGDHRIEVGNEFLASNEYDWHNMSPKDYKLTDLLIGFATNSAWDIGFRKNAKHMVMVDWSPQPVYAQSHIVAPLLRLATTPQELILMVSGIPASRAHGLSLAQAFALAKSHDYREASGVKESALELLNTLAKDSRISESELRFLTSYFSPRIYGQSSKTQYGPFALREWKFALLNDFWSARYNPDKVGDIESVFSSQANFNWLRNIYNGNRVKYAVADINDPKFLQAVRQTPAFLGSNDITLSVSNVFDCCNYDGTNFSGFQRMIRNALQIFDQGMGSKLTVFRTTRGVPPHRYFRYEIKSVDDVPRENEDPYTNQPEEPFGHHGILNLYGPGRGGLYNLR